MIKFPVQICLRFNLRNVGKLLVVKEVVLINKATNIYTFAESVEKLRKDNASIDKKSKGSFIKEKLLDIKLFKTGFNQDSYTVHYRLKIRKLKISNTHLSVDRSTRSSRLKMNSFKSVDKFLI